MYGTGMNAFTLGHYQQVARKMNNYVAASAYNYYSGRDQVAIDVYPNFSYGNQFASGSKSVSLSNSIANIAYRLGALFD